MAIKVYAETGKPIHIGRIKENLATTVVFDVSNQIQNFGSDGEFTLLIFQENTLFEESITYKGNLVLEWDVAQDRLLKKGEGKCQLVYENNSVISKSDIYDLVVTYAFEPRGDE